MRAFLLLLAAALCAMPAQAQPKDEAAEDEAAQQAVAKKVVTQGEVCADPARPCLEIERFKPNELSFRTYTNVNRKAGFVAVYAGRSEAEAKAFLAEARARYPDANLRRMQVVITYQME